MEKYLPTFLSIRENKLKNTNFFVHYVRIPEKFIKHIEGIKGLYETRIKLGSNIWRVFSFFDEGKLVVLLNGFQKKTQKTPKIEIERAITLMNEYFKEKNYE